MAAQHCPSVCALHSAQEERCLSGLVLPNLRTGFVFPDKRRAGVCLVQCTALCLVQYKASEGILYLLGSLSLPRWCMFYY